MTICAEVEEAEGKVFRKRRQQCEKAGIVKEGTKRKLGK